MKWEISISVAVYFIDFKLDLHIPYVDPSLSLQPQPPCIYCIYQNSKKAADVPLFSNFRGMTSGTRYPAFALYWFYNFHCLNINYSR